jgi:predicted ribosome quality control (RQC) complex YloA/Tae2 family protein
VEWSPVVSLGGMRAPTSFDSVVLAAVVADLRPHLGSRVRRVVQPGPTEVAIELRGRRAPTILLSAHARWARIHLGPPAGRGEAGPFAQMVRARLEGALLAVLEHPAFERSLTLRFESDRGRYELVGEVMGRHSNLILVEGGVIAGALKLIDQTHSSVREVLPGRPFTPPPRDRRPPGEIDIQQLRSFLAATDAPLAQALTAGVLGISPVMARELSVRAGLDPDTPAARADGAAVHEALEKLAATVAAEAFSPVLYIVDGLPAGYAAFPLVHLRSLGTVPAVTMSEAVARVSGQLGATAALDEQRRALGSAIRTALRKIERADAALRRALEEAEGGATLRTRGELLLAYASQIPPGSTETVLPGFGGEAVSIPLDPLLTPVENARRLFDRYAKMRDARPQLEARVAAVADDRRYLESALALAETASTIDDVAGLRAELADEGYLPRRRMGPATLPKARTFMLSSGAQVLVGRSNQDNDRVTFKAAGPDDFWFHARGVPGAHVVLRTGGRDPNEDEVGAAAGAAAYFSAARDAAHVAVDYTERKHVRKPRGSKPGMVTYRRERTVQAVPRIPGS